MTPEAQIRGAATDVTTLQARNVRAPGRPQVWNAPLGDALVFHLKLSERATCGCSAVHIFAWELQKKKKKHEFNKNKKRNAQMMSDTGGRGGNGKQSTQNLK